jgi:murein DD-endopeptidase MepM/ murein hydrolase activator NlpD
MRFVFATLTAIVILLGGSVWWFKFDHHAPRAALTAPLSAIGRKTPVDIDVQADTPGVRAVRLRLQAAGNTYDLLTDSVPATSWRGSGVTEKRVRVDADLAALNVPEGPATLEVFVDTYGWHLPGTRRGPQLSLPLTVDMTPPTVEVLTTQHNVRLGGVELVVFRESSDTVRSGVEVDGYFFSSVRGYFSDPSIALGFFAIPQDLSADVRPLLVAQDAAGNRREVAIPCTIKPRRFADRTLAIDDAFLTTKVPELERANNLPHNPDPLQGYLAINRDLRKRNDAQIRELTAKSLPTALWDGAFHRQTNAAPLSSFADRRTYTYKGTVVDHQTHLGFDLASLKLSPVEAAQAGVVVFADNLGIYGNAVIIDHGLGIFTLYGHLSTLAVHAGERVTTGQTLGQTGATGLASGDHLHFTVLLQGVPVDPVEWWDGKWIKDHITAKLAMFPRSVPAAKEPADEQKAP